MFLEEFSLLEANVQNGAWTWTKCLIAGRVLSKDVRKAAV